MEDTKEVQSKSHRRRSVTWGRILTQTTKGENAGAMRKHKRNGAEEKDLAVVSQV